MKLFHSTASPYVRKVMVLAIETGLAPQLELCPAVVSPVARAAAVAAHNPSGHIPTLLLDDGQALFDSRVICEYLDSLHDGAPMQPREALARARVQCLHAIADGILDAAVLVRFELALRPYAMRWPAWIDGQWDKVSNSLMLVERDWIGHLAGPLDIGAIATGCALGYLDFRFPDRPWRDHHPRLAQWFATFNARPSMLATWPAAVASLPLPQSMIGTQDAQ